MTDYKQQPGHEPVQPAKPKHKKIVVPPLSTCLPKEYVDEYRQRAARTKARDERVEFDGIKNHIWTKGVQLAPGVYTEQFRGGSANITRCMNAFHQTLQYQYNGQGRILGTSAVQLDNGTCMYVTFELF